MKKIILLSASLMLLGTAFAQSDRYQSAMVTNIAKMETLQKPEDFQALAATFERVADAEKTQWLPYYYAALTTIWNGFVDQKANKDELANKADALIAKAEAIEPKSSEIFLLKNMAATLHMIVDPQNRWQKYGGMSGEALATAKQLDPNNPRVYMQEGQSLMQTPAQFGGGMDKAKPVLEKAVALYATFKPASPIHPSWGKSTAEELLAKTK